MSSIDLPDVNHQLIAFTAIRYDIRLHLSNSSSIVPLVDAIQNVQRELRLHRLSDSLISWITRSWLFSAIQQFNLGNADAIELLSSNQNRYCIIGMYREPQLWLSNAVWCAHIDLNGRAQIKAPFCRAGLLNRAEEVWEIAGGTP